MTSHSRLEHKSPGRVREALFNLDVQRYSVSMYFPGQHREGDFFASGCKLIVLKRSRKDMSEPFELRNASWLTETKGAIDLE